MGVAAPGVPECQAAPGPEDTPEACPRRVVAEVPGRGRVASSAGVGELKLSRRCGQTPALEWAGGERGR